MNKMKTQSGYQYCAACVAKRFFISMLPFWTFACFPTLASVSYTCTLMKHIIFCSPAFHQACHRPVIPDSALELSAPWTCVFCTKGLTNPYLKSNEENVPFTEEDQKPAGRRKSISTASTRREVWTSAWHDWKTDCDSFAYLSRARKLRGLHYIEKFNKNGGREEPQGNTEKRRGFRRILCAIFLTSEPFENRFRPWEQRGLETDLLPQKVFIWLTLLVTAWLATWFCLLTN